MAVGEGKLTFVVGVKDDVRIILVRRGDGLPERLHASCIGDDLIIVTSVVVWHDHRVRPLVCDVLDGL